MKILVADDCGLLAPTCIVFLSYWGHEVEVAHDGIEALRKARAWRPDLVLARVRLERMDGPCLVSALRAGGGLSETAVVLVGSAEDVDPRRGGARLGADGFLETPLVVAELARTIERLAARRRAGGRQLAAVEP